MKQTAYEKSKNQELEKEFIVLRGLIAESQRQSGAQENLMIKSQYE